MRTSDSLGRGPKLWLQTEIVLCLVRVRWRAMKYSKISLCVTLKDCLSFASNELCLSGEVKTRLKRNWFHCSLCALNHPFLQTGTCATTRSEHTLPPVFTVTPSFTVSPLPMLLVNKVSQLPCLYSPYLVTQTNRDTERSWTVLRMYPCLMSLQHFIDYTLLCVCSYKRLDSIHKVITMCLVQWVSSVLEKAVADELLVFIHNNCIFEKFQSGFRKFHTT